MRCNLTTSRRAEAASQASQHGNDIEMKKRDYLNDGYEHVTRRYVGLGAYQRHLCVATAKLGELRLAWRGTGWMHLPQLGIRRLRPYSTVTVASCWPSEA